MSGPLVIVVRWSHQQVWGINTPKKAVDLLDVWTGLIAQNAPALTTGPA